MKLKCEEKEEYKRDTIRERNHLLKDFLGLSVLECRLGCSFFESLVGGAGEEPLYPIECAFFIEKCKQRWYHGNQALFVLYWMLRVFLCFRI